MGDCIPSSYIVQDMHNEGADVTVVLYRNSAWEPEYGLCDGAVVQLRCDFRK